MSAISIRKLDENIYKELRIRAAKHGISMEEEVRQIIYEAIATTETTTISAVFKKHFGFTNGIDLQLNKHPHEPMEFDR